MIFKLGSIQEIPYHSFAIYLFDVRQFLFSELYIFFMWDGASDLVVRKIESDKVFMIFRLVQNI